MAHSRIVALGRDMVIAGEALSHAVALNGSVRVSGRVEGDLIVLGGAVELASTARVEGDVFILGGHLDAAPGALIGGRSVAYPEASQALVTLIEGPALGLSSASPIVIGAKLALLAFWALVALLLFAVSGREMLSTSESIRVEPFRNFMLGLTGIFSMVLTALLCSAVSGAFLTMPLLVLVAVAALVLRFWGMVAVFHALGGWLCERLAVRRPVPLVSVCCGLLALGLLKLIPWIGIWTWSLATFIGVGAALSTKLGRREAWFDIS